MWWVGHLRHTRPPHPSSPKPAPVSDPVAKRARSVAHRAMLSPHKPTLWTQLSKDPTAPLPTFHPAEDVVMKIGAVSIGED